METAIGNSLSVVLPFIQVQAKEVGTPEGRGLSRPIQLRVHLNDINDNSPVLPLINPVTLESGDGVRTVMKVEAADNDEGENAKITYSIYHISNNGAERFSIDPDTGDLKVRTPVDAGEQFSITVQATDAGGLYAQGIIEVMVIPGPNLGGPIFAQEEYRASVSSTSTQIRLSCLLRHSLKTSSELLNS